MPMVADEILELFSKRQRPTTGKMFRSLNMRSKRPNARNKAVRVMD